MATPKHVFHVKNMFTAALEKSRWRNSWARQAPEWAARVTEREQRVRPDDK